MTKVSIGLFDSGVGGLTVLRAIHARLPGMSTAYLGDTARVPYGTRSPQTVVRYALNAARFLVVREQLSLLVVACNTASAVSIEALRRELSVPVLGVIEPTAERACKISRSGRIGIIGTRGTVDSGAYQRAVMALRPDAMISARACPLLVPLAEEGWVDVDDSVALETARRYLQPFLEDQIDTLILGCTHYPLLQDIIREVVGTGVTLVDAAAAVAETTARILGPSVDQSAEAVHNYYVTDNPASFSAVANRFLGRGIRPPIEVDL